MLLMYVVSTRTPPPSLALPLNSLSASRYPADSLLSRASKQHSYLLASSQTAKMHAVKHAAASAKEKVGNVGAKADLKKDEVKIDAQEKAGKAMASDKIEKQQVKADSHAKQAEALRNNEAAKGQNAAEKDAIKTDLDNRKAAAKEVYKTPGATPGDL